MAVVVQLRSDSTHFERTATALDGVSYVMEFRWNTRNETWYLTMSLEDGTVLASSLAVVIGWPIGARVTHADWPPGVLVAVDTSGTNTDPGEEDLGARVRLEYFTAAEVAEVEAAADALMA